MRNALRQKRQFLILPSCERPRCTRRKPELRAGVLPDDVGGGRVPYTAGNSAHSAWRSGAGRTDSASRSTRTAHAFRVVVHCIRPPEAASAAPAEIANPDAVGDFQSAVVSRRACASVRLLLSGGCDSVSPVSAH